MSYLIPLSIFLILFAVITWRDFEWGLFILMMLLPAYVVRFDIGPLPSTALEAMIVIVVAVWLIKRGAAINVKRLTRSTFFWPGILLLVAAGLSIIWAADTKDALGIYKAYFVEPFLLYLILIDTLKTKEQWKKIFIALGLSTLALAVMAVIQRATGWWSPTWEWTLPDSRRVTGPFTSPNSLGLFVGPITALYVGWIFIKEGDTHGNETQGNASLRHFKWAVIIAGALAIILAVSKGAMIALLAAVLLIIYKAWSKKWTAGFLVIGILAILLIPASRNAVIDIATFQTASGQSRLALYEGSWQLLKENPFQGVGLASFAQSFENVRAEGFTEKLIYPHNIFLNFWSETGLLGLMAVLWIIAIIVGIIKKRQEYGWPWFYIAALTVMLVHGLVDVPYFKNDLAILTWVILAGLAASIYLKPSKLKEL